jgi:hypothetical protein
MEFIMNELINGVLEKYFETFEKTLDTTDYVPEKYGKKIHAFIFRCMKQKFAETKSAYRSQLRKEKRTVKISTQSAAHGLPAPQTGAIILRPSPPLTFDKKE